MQTKFLTALIVMGVWLSSVMTDAHANIHNLKSACDNGDMRACVNLGVQYRHGTGVPQDDRKALALYRRACGNGYKFACGYVGDMLYRGLGATQDKYRGEQLLRQGCKDGNQWTCTAIRRYGLED